MTGLGGGVAVTVAEDVKWVRQLIPDACTLETLHAMAVRDDLLPLAKHVVLWIAAVMIDIRAATLGDLAAELTLMGLDVGTSMGGAGR